MRYRLNDIRYTASIMLIFITALWLCSSAGAADRIVKMQEAAWTLDDAKKAILELVGEPDYPIKYMGHSGLPDSEVFWGKPFDVFEVNTKLGYIFIAIIQSNRDRRHNDLLDPMHGKALVSVNQAAEKAKAVAVKMCPMFTKMNMVKNPFGSDIPHKTHWKAIDPATGIYLPVEVFVTIDSLNGRIVGYHSEISGYHIKEKWNLTEAKAVTIAREAAGPEFAKIPVKVWRYTGVDVNTKGYYDAWQVQFQQYKRSAGDYYGFIVIVDDATGKIRATAAPG